jgi:hypothetical protein
VTDYSPEVQSLVAVFTDAAKDALAERLPVLAALTESDKIVAQMGTVNVLEGDAVPEVVPNPASTPHDWKALGSSSGRVMHFVGERLRTSRLRH